MNANERQLVADFIEALMLEAEHQAFLVGEYLTILGAAPGFEWLTIRPLALPEELLFGLGSALRLAEWEARGLATRLGTSLPPSTQAVLDVFRAVVDEPARTRTRQLIVEVQSLYFTRFAWMASIGSRADVVLGSPSEDVLVDAIADLVWKSRNLLHRDQAEQSIRIDQRSRQSH
jgi:hypothetical protein